MEKRKRSKAEWIRRYVSFVFILFVIAFGASLSIRANLGSSPISAPPYVLSLVPGMPMTMGQIVICMHVVFILTQILLLRRNYELRQLSQILVSFLFGFYTDLTMWLTSFLQIPPPSTTRSAGPAVCRAPDWRCAAGLRHRLRGALRLADAGWRGPAAGHREVCEERLRQGEDVFRHGPGDHRRRPHDHVLRPLGLEDGGLGTLVSMFYVGFMVRVFAPPYCLGSTSSSSPRPSGASWPWRKGARSAGPTTGRSSSPSRASMAAEARCWANNWPCGWGWISTTTTSSTRPPSDWATRPTSSATTSKTSPTANYGN